MEFAELLAPAGNMEALKAAVAFGADAVYLGGKLHNARINAKNFDNNEIEQAIRFARLRGKRVYITLNTLLFEEELDGLISYTNMLQDMGVNAVIVQDFGVAKILLENTTMPIHASTQMGIHNLEGCKVLERWGIERAILSRETPLTEIRRITENCNIQVEAFVHGALCACFSGQCLYSYLKGGRSGNRGACAQPCRLPTGDDYPLSTKDLMSLDTLPSLIDAGIASFKIEGRMKRPEYVGVVTDVYRRALDCIYENGKMETEKWKEQLIKIYNRGGFTAGYFNGGEEIFGNKRPNHMGEEIGNVKRVDKTKVTIDANKTVHVYDGLSFGKVGMEISDLYAAGQRVQHASGTVTFSCVQKGIAQGDKVFRTTDRLQIEAVREEMDKDDFYLAISMECTVGDRAELKLTCGENTVCAVSEFVPQQALNRATNTDDITKAMAKLGDTVFTLDKLDAKVEDGLFIPIKELNALRRQGIELLEKSLIAGEGREKKVIVEKISTPIQKPAKVEIGFGKRKSTTGIYLAYPKGERIAGVDGYALPPVSFEADLAWLKKTVEPTDIVLCNNISHIEALSGLCRLWAGPGMNCTNTVCRDLLYSIGCEQVVCSIEANVPGTIKIAGGRIPAMTFVRCPRKEQQGCNNCGGGFACTKLENTYAFLLHETKPTLGEVTYI